eukprot:CAMPEP_0170399030 /NCGR_PEP_ID=MMETSP0117_2-20130122/23742_1 /TAXON_ID=400756 /ORGANISM="Durinskia baltica, Strain CSIRO CS-38" /LENGTH=120 /DNA_ID=CAMNT_0010655675 /DNA_START=9 /DNA_END=371 /DNA_ORIENTATION=+
MALRALVKSDLRRVSDKSSVAQLYRSIVRELPRVMTIYDVDMPLKEAKSAVMYHFRKHSALKDGRVIGLLIAKGYMELEETLMQWKQKTHLLRLLEPIELEQKFPRELTAREKLILNIED